MMAITSTVSRRSFIAAGAAATAAVGVAVAASLAHADEPAEAEPAEAAAPSSANPSWLGDEPEDGDIVDTLSCDVLIVGAGNGGMVAAATASELGVDFLIADSYDTPNDVRYWIGAINSKFTEEAGAEVDVTRLKYELARYASFKCDQKLQNMWINESAEMVERLAPLQEAVGAVCVVDTEMGPEIDPTCATGNYIPPQQHMFVDPDTGSQFAVTARNQVLLSYIEDAGNADRFLWNHELIKLVHEHGVVSGAIFDTDDGRVQVNANHVILATGGYPGNPDMIKALAPIVPKSVIVADYSPKDRGAGIKAGLWAGAAMDTESAPMVFNRGVVAPGVVCGYNENDQFPGTVAQLNLGSQPFMKVALDGKRFANESCLYDFICFAATEHTGGVWAQIFDSNAPEDVQRFATAGCSKATQETLAPGADIDEAYADYLEQGLMFKADTIDELADKLGFEGEAKEAFLAEVDRYNDFYDEQCDEDFGKAPYRLSELRNAPFCGCRYGGTLLTTCDGLRINEEMEVLDADCKPIEGLYAIGDCSGSFFANNYPEYLIGTACGRTPTEGRHIIRRIAGDL